MLYAAPVRVSATVVAVVASRAVVVRRFAVRAVVDRVICRSGRVIVVRVCGVMRNAPARVTVFGVAVRDTTLRVVVALRPVSVLFAREILRSVVVFVRRLTLVLSRTADTAGAHAKKPRIAPKIRIFFISDKKCSKISKTGASEKLCIFV